MVNVRPSAETRPDLAAAQAEHRRRERLGRPAGDRDASADQKADVPVALSAGQPVRRRNQPTASDSTAGGSTTSTEPGHRTVVALFDATGNGRVTFSRRATRLSPRMCIGWLSTSLPLASVWR